MSTPPSFTALLNCLSIYLAAFTSSLNSKSTCMHACVQRVYIDCARAWACIAKNVNTSTRPSWQQQHEREGVAATGTLHAHRSTTFKQHSGKSKHRPTIFLVHACIVHEFHAVACSNLLFMSGGWPRPRDLKLPLAMPVKRS
jgi:hypothetical protein